MDELESVNAALESAKEAIALSRHVIVNQENIIGNQKKVLDLRAEQMAAAKTSLVAMVQQLQSQKVQMALLRALVVTQDQLIKSLEG